MCLYGEEPGFQERLYSTGNYYLDTQLTQESLTQEEWPNYFEWYGEGALEDISRVKKLCEENGIELTVFVNPEFYVRWEEAIARGYLGFLEQLAQITDYYSFCGYNNVTTDMSNFHDISHYKQSVGDDMIYIMEQGNGITPESEEDRLRIESLSLQGFGRYVTARNVQEYLTNLQGVE